MAEVVLLTFFSNQSAADHFFEYVQQRRRVDLEHRAQRVEHERLAEHRAGLQQLVRLAA